MRQVHIGRLKVGNDLPMIVIAGPCQLESSDHAQMIAGRMAESCAAVGAGYVFKASFDKANRTSLSGRRGVGMDAGLKILSDLRTALDVPVLTDVHLPDQCAATAEAVDILQIPAFLCRQTDLLVAAAQTRAVVNIKKGQFLAPWDMAHVAAKVEDSGNNRILLTERGTCFGYNTLVADMPQPATDGGNWISGHHGRHTFGSAARWVGRCQWRPEGVRAGHGPGSRIARHCRRVH